jgi:hypothetical protein
VNSRALSAPRALLGEIASETKTAMISAMKRDRVTRVRAPVSGSS